VTPPDLNDPVQRAAYRQELRGVARPLRYTGVLFAVLGAVLALVRHLWAPQMPTLIPLATIALGALNMLAGIVVRMRYHQARLKGGI
jgi:hypothetical protein